MKLQTLAGTVAVACACAAILAGTRAIHVSQDRRMERFYDQAIQSDYLAEDKVNERLEHTIETIKERLTLPKSLSSADYMKRVEEAPMMRNLARAALAQAEEESQTLRRSRQESSTHRDEHQRHREQNTFF